MHLHLIIHRLHVFEFSRSKPWKIRLPLLILHKEKSSYGAGSDAVITQDILENKSEKPVRTTIENIESELADHTTTSHGCIRHPPTWRTEYHTTTTTTTAITSKSENCKSLAIIIKDFDPHLY
jgi:hypothetical protein